METLENKKKLVFIVQLHRITSLYQSQFSWTPNNNGAMFQPAGAQQDMCYHANETTDGNSSCSIPRKKLQ
jgi:hypothetical protein